MKRRATKAERLAQARRDVEKTLKKVGYTGNKGHKAEGNPFPDYDCSKPNTVECSNGMGNMIKKDNSYKLGKSVEYIIQPAYNKGGLQVVGRDKTRRVK